MRSWGAIVLNWIMALAFAVLPACPAEDSNNCKWDASRQGNGIGQSFIAVADYVFLVEVR